MLLSLETLGTLAVDRSQSRMAFYLRLNGQLQQNQEVSGKGREGEKRNILFLWKVATNKVAKKV
jgi:hypothetical protein